MSLTLPSTPDGDIAIDLCPRCWGTAPAWDQDFRALQAYILRKASRLDQLALSSEQALKWQS
eukprot:14641020-Alexandrium_andersonii.AAC.1